MDGVLHWESASCCVAPWHSQSCVVVLQCDPMPTVPQSSSLVQAAWQVLVVALQRLLVLPQTATFPPPPSRGMLTTSCANGEAQAPASLGVVAQRPSPPPTSMHTSAPVHGLVALQVTNQRLAIGTQSAFDSQRLSVCRRKQRLLMHVG